MELRLLRAYHGPGMSDITSVISFSPLKNVTDCLQFTEEKMRFQFAMSYNKGVAEPKLGIPDPLQDTQLGTLILMTHFPLEVNS